MNSKLCMVLLMLFIRISIIYSQNDFPQQINTQLNNYLLDNLQEKLYIQTNSNRYYPGDTIWYKATLVNAINHKLVRNEKMFYIDLVSPENKIVSHLLYSITNGLSDGSVTLDQKLGPGHYKLLAYTNYMRNFNNNFLFQKSIDIEPNTTNLTTWNFNSKITPVTGGDSVYVKIYGQTRNGRELNENVDIHLQLKRGTLLGANCSITNNIGSFNFFVPDSLKLPDALLTVIPEGNNTEVNKYKINLSTQKPDLQFLPEGGELVAELKNKVAFRCINTNGTPLNISGSIKTNAGQTVASFSTEYEGMGKFYFTPDENQVYYAQITYRDSLFSYKLPEIKKNAYSLRLTKQASDTIHLTILKNGNKEPDFLLLGHCRGSIRFMAKGIVHKQESTFSIPTVNLPEGIVTFTLFINQKPTSERLVYNIKDTPFDFNLTEIDNKQNDSITNYLLQVTGKDGSPVNGNFSLTGWNNHLENSIDSLENIRNYLLFTSDIQGEVLSNNTIFNYTSPETSEERDLMLAVYGWRRFNWDNIVSYQKKELPFSTEKDLYLKGKIYRRFSGKPAPNNTEIAMALNQPGSIYIDKAYTNEKGEFSFVLPSFTDSANLTIQTKNKFSKQKDYIVDINTNLEKFHINSMSFDKVSKCESSPLVLNFPSIPETFKQNKKDKKDTISNVLSKPLPHKNLRIDNYYFPGKDTFMIEEVEARSKYLNRRDSILSETGEPDVVIESSQLKQLTNEKVWYNDIWDLLEDQIPGLIIQQSTYQPWLASQFNLVLTDENDNAYVTADTGKNNPIPDANLQDYFANYIPSGSSAIYFDVIDNPDGYLYIFVDKYCLNISMASAYEFMNSLNPGQIESIDFVSKPKNFSIDMSLSDIISQNNLKINSDITGNLSNTLNNTELTSFKDHLDAMKTMQKSAAAPSFLIFTTKTKGGLFYKYAKGLQSLYLTGFAPQREFYVPKYNSKESAAHENQFRKTVLWQPELTTNKSGTGTISIPKGTVGPNTTFQFQGISATGESISHTFKLYSSTQNNYNTNPTSTLYTNTETANNFDKYAPLQLYSGVITDKESGKPVPYANLFQTTPFYHERTNNDGEFLLSKEKLKDNKEITITSPGYKTQKITIPSNLTSSIDIQLEKAKIRQTNNKEKPISIVRNAIRNSQKLYASKTTLVGYNRESITIDNNVYSIYETGFNYSNTTIPGSATSIRFETLKFKHMEDKSSNKLMVLQPNHRSSFYPVKTDVIANPSEFWNYGSLEYFDYQKTGEIEYAGETCDKIYFHQKENLVSTLQTGILYIGKQSGALRYASWSTTPDKRKYASYTNFLQSNPMNYDVQLIYDNYEVSYAWINGKLYPLSTNQQQSILVNGQNYMEFTSKLSITGESERKFRDLSNENSDIMIKNQKSRHMLVKEPVYRIKPWLDFGIIKPEAQLLQSISYLHDITVNR